jgi:hypothetical protein
MLFDFSRGASPEGRAVDGLVAIDSAARLSGPKQRLEPGERGDLLRFSADGFLTASERQTLGALLDAQEHLALHDQAPRLHDVLEETLRQRRRSGSGDPVSTDESAVLPIGKQAEGPDPVAIVRAKDQLPTEGSDDQIFGVIARRSVLCADDATASQF